MGILNDVMTIIKTSVDSGELKKNLTSKKYSSIATRASEGTLQFPILISDSMDIDTAQMIVKALERNYATFVQTVLSMNSVSHETDIAQYLKQFHQNYSPEFSDVTTANIVATFAESYDAFEYDDGKFVVTETYNNVSTGKISLSNREQNINLLDDLRVDILNRKFKPRSEVLYNFKNPAVSRKYNNIHEAYLPPTLDEIEKAMHDRGIYEDDPEWNRYVNAFYDEHRYDYEQKHARNQREHEKSEYQKERDRVTDLKDYNKDVYKRGQDALKNQRDDAELALKIENNNIQNAKSKQDIAKSKYEMNTKQLPPQMLKDNDVKKANELIATVMHARIHMLNNENEPIGIQDFMLGIKGTMHPIKSEEMISNMVGACKNNNKVFNFLRWTTGEISFFKDFWLNTSEMKRDVANESKGASRWWIALKNRRALSQMQSSAFIKNRVLPNATIVLSAEEAEIIRTHYGYDVTNPYFMNKIMKTYYLLGFVIVDNSAQIAHFFFDGNMDFESVSFSGLEKENTRDERKFKEMLKVINRN